MQIRKQIFWYKLTNFGILHLVLENEIVFWDVSVSLVLAVDSNPRVESTQIDSTSKMSTRLDSRRLEIFISFSVISRYQIHSYISNTSPASILVYEGLPATHSGPIRGHITKGLLY